MQVKNDFNESETQLKCNCNKSEIVSEMQVN